LNRLLIIIALFTLSLVAQGCRGGYSFTGTSISPDVKTVTIDFITNMAPIVYPPLSSNLTDALKDRFMRNTRLTLEPWDGDLHFEGTITNYDVTSMAVTAAEVAATNRLNITVRMRFTNNKDDKQSYDRSFSNFADFPSIQSLDSVQDQLVSEIIDKLVEDIFNAAVANW